MTHCGDNNFIVYTQWPYNTRPKCMDIHLLIKNSMPNGRYRVFIRLYCFFKLFTITHCNQFECFLFRSGKSFLFQKNTNLWNENFAGENLLISYNWLQAGLGGLPVIEKYDI
jgi:hypothetical protein